MKRLLQCCICNTEFHLVGNSIPKPQQKNFFYLSTIFIWVVHSFPPMCLIFTGENIFHSFTFLFMHICACGFKLCRLKLLCADRNASHQHSTSIVLRSIMKVLNNSGEFMYSRQITDYCCSLYIFHVYPLS